MTHLELSVDIQASAVEVWNGITNWPAQSDWMMGTRVSSLDGDGHAVGARLEAFTGVGKVGFLDTMEITTWQPPVRCDVLHTGAVVRGTGTFVVEPIHDSASRFIWSEDLDIPLGIIGKFGFAIIRPLFMWGIKKSLAKFAHLVEIGQM